MSDYAQLVLIAIGIIALEIPLLGLRFLAHHFG